MTYAGHRDQRFGSSTYSQHGEDLVFMALAEDMPKDRPLWLDIGAHHPINISNTHLLSLNGFHGVNVEANPNLIGEFIKQRPRDINVNLGVGLQEGTQTFLMYYPASGRNTFSQIEAKAYGRPVRQTMELPVVTLESIVNRYCGGHWPPFLFMDIEGMDYEVLAAQDFFSDESPDLICVETRLEYHTEMTNMLEGYSLMLRMGENNLYLSNAFTFPGLA